MVAAGLRQVFAEGRYILLAAATGLAVFILATWLPNLGLVWQIAASASIPFADKVNVLTALVGSIGTNFTVFSALSTVAIAALFGATVAMMAYYFRVRRQLVRQAGQAAACGTFVLSPVLSFVGASGLIALFPFGGEEFGALGVAMLAFSLVLTAMKIGEPLACPLGPPDETERRQPSRRLAGLFRALAINLGTPKSSRGSTRREET